MEIDADAMLQAYGINTPFPNKWQNSNITSALSSLAAGESSEGGVNVEDLLESLTANHTVAQDELDPLGSGLTILQLLQQQSKIVPKSAAERAVYMPSSTSFDPRKFLSDCHATSSLADLQKGLAYLKQKLAQAEQGGRKENVDQEYEAFVHSKQRLDEVMQRLDEIGVREDTGFAMDNLNKQLSEVRSELAMRTQPVDAVNSEKLRLENALRAIEKHRKLLEVPQLLAQLAETNEHDQFVREYKKGTKLISHSWGQSVDPVERELAAFMLAGAQKVRSQYISRLKKELMSTPADGAYTPLIARLMDLGAHGNPAVEWLQHNIHMFQGDIDQVFDTLATHAAQGGPDLAESPRKPEMIQYLRHLVSNTPTALILPANLKSARKAWTKNEITDLVDVHELCEQLSVDAWVDTEAAVALWVQLVDAFERLRQILNRCTIFFREFMSLSMNSGASATSWQLNNGEFDEVRHQCRELVLHASQRLVAHFTSKSSVLGPEDSEDLAGSLSFLPNGTNSLAIAKYLSTLLDTLTLMSAQVADLTPQANQPRILGDATALIRRQFVQILCSSWVRDSQQLGRVQDWSRLDNQPGLSQHPKLPQYFAAYHGIILEHLRFMLDQSRGGGPAPQDLIEMVAKIFPTALSLSIRSVETALVDSTKTVSLADSQLAEMRAQLLPASLNQDAKLLVTLSYLETLRHTGLQQVYKQFDSAFRLYRIATQAIRDEITPEVDKISSQLFDIYIRKKRAKISQVVDQEFTRLVPIWARPDESVTGVSNYIYECLMIVVETHALFTESCPQLTRPAILKLFEHLLDVMLAQLRGLDVLNRFGTLQNVADMEFMRWAMSEFEEPYEKYQAISSAIRRISTDAEVWRLEDGPRKAVYAQLENAARQSHYTFAALKSFPRK